MFKNILILFLTLSISYAKDIKPYARFISSGFVNDFIVANGYLHIGNDEGVIDIFDIKTKKLINQISLPTITSSTGKIISADILSVDYLNKKILILSVGKNGYRNVWIYKNHELKQIINEDKKLTIKEARFVNDEQIILGTLDSDIILHDTNEQYNLYHTHISQSAMGDMTLSDDKKTLLLADESGSVKIIDIKSSKILHKYDSQNVDNIFKLAYANGVTITAGQDRRVGVYPKKQKPYYIKSNFLVFCVGISPDGKTGVYSSGEQSHLQVFNINTKTNKSRLVGHNGGVINKIIFINKNEVFSSDRTNTILHWKIN